MSESAGKFAKLINELSQETKEGKLAWEDTADEEEFRAVLKPGMVRLVRPASCQLFEEGDSMTLSRRHSPESGGASRRGIRGS